MTRNKAWEKALFGRPQPCADLTRVTGEQITKYCRIIETASRRATATTSSRERAILLGIADEAEAHLKALQTFMTKEQKARVEKTFRQKDIPF